MHGRIYIVLKESLKRIPVIGWGMQFSQFIFLKRNWEKDKPRLATHLQKFNKPNLPMWLVMFPEGTNLADSTRERSKQWAQKNGIDDMKHQLLPRSTGLQFCLQQLRNTTEWVYDCTIAYEGVPRGEFAQDIYTVKASYFGGRPPKSVNMYWRRFAISSIPLDDSRAFEHWLRARWTEKDNLIEYYYQHGSFPADVGVDKGPDGNTRRGAGYIETQVRPAHWYEFLQIFAPTGLFALILYCFYGALPRRLIKSFNKQAIVDTIDAVKQNQLKGLEKKPLSDYAINALVSNIGTQNAVAAQKGLIGLASKALGNSNSGQRKALIAPNAHRALVDAASTQLASAARSAIQPTQVSPLTKPQQQKGRVQKSPITRPNTQKSSVNGALKQKKVAQRPATQKTSPGASTPQKSSTNGAVTKPVANKKPLKKQQQDRTAPGPSANGTATKAVENKIPLAKQHQNGIAQKASSKASTPQKAPSSQIPKSSTQKSTPQDPSANGVVTKPIENKIPLAKQQPPKQPTTGPKTKPVTNPTPKALQGKNATASAAASKQKA